MPRPAATAEVVESEPVVSDEAQVAEEASTEAAEAPKKRQRRQAPEGVKIGLSGPKKADALPPVVRGGGRGRGVDKATLETIEALEAEPGEWFEIGLYSNCTPPKGVWEERGIKFTHRKRDDNGLFIRYAMKPVEGSEAADAE